MLIHKVDQGHRKQADEKLMNVGDIYREVEGDDRGFREKYNKPVETALFRAIKNDLEKEELLERRFRAEKMEDVLN